MNGHAHHHHDHDHHNGDFGRAFAIGITLNLGFVVVEAVCGFIANSMSLLADGGQIVLSVLRHPPRSRLSTLAVLLNRWTRADWTMSEGDVFTRVVGSAVRYEHYFADGELERELTSAGLHSVAELEDGTVHVAAP